MKMAGMHNEAFYSPAWVKQDQGYPTGMPIPAEYVLAGAQSKSKVFTLKTGELVFEHAWFFRAWRPPNLNPLIPTDGEQFVIPFVTSTFHNQPRSGPILGQRFHLFPADFQPHFSFRSISYGLLWHDNRMRRYQSIRPHK
jgi:hypothetical protein